MPAERLAGDAMPDFFSLDSAVEGTEDAGPAEERSLAGGLLDDYVALGLIAPTQSTAAAAAAPPSRPLQLTAVPWLASLKGFSSPLLQLHQEIVEFCRYLTPSPGEAVARQEAIDRVTEVVRSIWPTARVEVFGSFATGLYLPTSDIDAVVLGSGCTNIPAGLKALATALARKSLVKDMQVIAKARVPIVKFEETGSGYNFDVSFDVANGPEAAGNVRALMDSLPPMRPLVMVLKVFLQQRELNEVYSGGVGSYALLVMVATFLQTHPSRSAPAAAGSGRYAHHAPPLEQNLGVLLLDYLRLYGRALANMHVGVSCRKGGAFFSKRDKGFFNAERPYLLAVEDPNDPANDLGKNSYNISRVRMAFDFAYCQLVAPATPGESLLQRVIRLDPVLFLRAPPAPLALDSDTARTQGRSQSPEAAGERGCARGKRKRREDAARQQQRSRSPAVADKRESTEKNVGAAEKRRKVEGDGGRGRPEQGGNGKGKKRRHRERSASDDDLGGGGGGKGRRQDNNKRGGSGRHGSQHDSMGKRNKHKGVPSGEGPYLGKGRKLHGESSHSRSHIRFD